MAKISLISFLVSGVSSSAGPAPAPAKVWLTRVSNNALQGQALSPQGDINWNGWSEFGNNTQTTAPLNSISLNVDGDNKLQEMIGYGAALPHSSAKVLVDLKNRNSGLYWQVLRRLFSQGQDNAAINMLRFPIGVCDFSMHWNTWDDAWNLPGRVDWQFSNFKPDADTELIFEVLRDAQVINPDLLLMATPWTPPSWFKVQDQLSGENDGNTIKPGSQYINAYANYLNKVAQWMRNLRLPIKYMSLQNEPLNGQTSIPAMYLPADRSAELARALRPLLDREIELLAYDHNWDHPEYPKTALQDAGDAFAGTAWHCYGGHVGSAQEELHNAFPSKLQLMTECTANYGKSCDISKGMSNFGWDNQWDMENLFLGNAAHWGQAGMKWIIALDENCGPTLQPPGNWHGRGVIAVPSYAGSMNDIKFNQDFWTISTMARFVNRGSRRVSTSGSRGNAIVEAFRDDNYKTMTLLAANNDHNNGVQMNIQFEGHSIQYYLPGWSTVVIRWDIDTSSVVV